MLVAVITSAANPLVKRIRKLRDRRARQAERAFYVEGVQPVWRAHDAGADIEVLVVSPELMSGGPAGPLVDGFVRAGGALVEVSRDVFAAMSERDGPAGVAAVVRLPVTSLSDIAVHPGAVVVGLHDVANPGNLGTIVRTADAFGAAGVVLIGDTADAYSPAAVKASMGSLFALPVVTVGAVGEAFEWATGAQLSVVTTSARGAIAVPRAVVPKPSLVVFGNEGAGLPPDVIAAGSLDLRIPMRGSASSLNLAVAAGIVLYLATA